MYEKIIAWVLIFSGMLAIASTNNAVAETQMQISASAAVVVNADSGEVIYAKNANEKLAIASTTKIMTALLTLEKAETNDKVVTVTDEMVRVEGSSMGLHAGDRLTLKNIASGMLAISGNDAANSAAIAISGSKEAFSEQMNKRASELGMKNTHFVTPSGLDDDAHYSTAQDMSILACAALKNPSFAEIVRQKTMKVSFLSPQKVVQYTNHNKLLSQYEGCIGVKTGFTKKAGRCLVSAAEKNGVRIVCVTLHDPNDWKDHEQLLDYGFSLLARYTVDDSACRWQLPVVGGAQEHTMVYGESGTPVVVRKDQMEKIQRIVELPHFSYAPVEKGQTLGTVRYVLNGKMIASTNLTVQEPVLQPSLQKSRMQKIWEFIIGFFP